MLKEKNMSHNQRKKMFGIVSNSLQHKSNRKEIEEDILASMIKTFKGNWVVQQSPEPFTDFTGKIKYMHIKVMDHLTDKLDTFYILISSQKLEIIL